MSLTSMTLLDYSDRELLFRIADNVDPKVGYARTEDVAKDIGLTGKRRNQCLGIRLGWMGNYGVVEKHPDKPKLWRVTTDGEKVMNGRLTAAERDMIQHADPGHLLMMTRGVTERVARGPDFAGHMIRREWNRGSSRNGVRRVEEPAISGRVRKVSGRRKAVA